MSAETEPELHIAWLLLPLLLILLGGVAGFILAT